MAKFMTNGNFKKKEDIDHMMHLLNQLYGSAKDGNIQTESSSADREARAPLSDGMGALTASDTRPSDTHTE